MLYHALKVYKLAPELRWTAGGYVWSVDQTVDISSDDGSGPITTRTSRPGVPPVRGTFSTQGDYDDNETDDLRAKVERSGGIPLAEAEIDVLNDPVYPGPISKERVPFVSASGDIERLVVNVLVVVYVP